MPDNLVAGLHKSVQRTPGATALIQNGTSYSYAQLWRLVCTIADFLRNDRRMEAGSRVAILSANSPHYVAAYYGILAAGCVVVALNTRARAKDLNNWLQHSDADWLFADAHHRELDALRDSVPGVTLLSGAAPLVREPPDAYRDGNTVNHLAAMSVASTEAFEPPDIAPAQLAAIIYTSGTTGRPKGVMLSHRNLQANADSILEYLRLVPSDRAMCVLPFYYSYGNSVLHTHLRVGACLVLEESFAYPDRVLEIMVAERVTGFPDVAATFALLMSRTRLADYDLSALRYMTQAGGPMPTERIRQLKQLLPRVDFFVMYGQTEATARLAWLPPAQTLSKPGSVGIAVPGVEFSIRDKQGEPAPKGGRGEIWARGDNIMLGYWRDEHATRQVRQDDWLLTGDLGYLDDDGYLYIDGRRSDMIKSGAHRIGPTEIEEVILQLEGVEEVAVTGIPDDILGQAIKAFVVLKPGTDLRTIDIRRRCSEQLALYKIPKQVAFIDALPRTASGKVQRHLLTDAPVARE